MTEATAEPITFADIEKSVTPDVVVARCRSYTFKGQPLHAFSKTRLTAARCMGHGLFTGMARRDERGFWAGMYLDSQIVVWLCFVDDARAVRACMRSDQALEEVIHWWEAEGGMPGSTEESEILSIHRNIIEDLETSIVEVDGTGSKDTGVNLGE